MSFLAVSRPLHPRTNQWPGSEPGPAPLLPAAPPGPCSRHAHSPALADLILDIIGLSGAKLRPIQTPPPAPPWPLLHLPCCSLGRDALGSFGLVLTGPIAPLQVALLQLMGSPELAQEEDAQQKQQLKTK